ncbi:hypothetical protein PVAND_001097 [Polypedilum vanderplanki]|uniref:Uncharacterized protein n=1 Tax=Polypedilum vanderplanki TaxID=319348 RepID=A0A9J6BMB2_POLVA|nr:hypothetical protein PVAND_001097 [Polypedilum vanderplanki]
MKIFPKYFIFLGVFLLFAPQKSEGFLDFILNLNLNINIELIFKFKFILNQALMIMQSQNQQEFDEIKRKIDQDFSIIQHELQSLTKQIDSGFSTIDKDLKMNPLIDLISKQTSYMDRFQIMVNTKSNSSEFIDQLEEFIKEYTRENLEDRMVNLIETKTQGTNSLVEALIKAAMKATESNEVAMRTSPNRLFYDFYMAMSFNVYRGYYFMESCILMKDILTKKLHENEHDYFRGMTQLSIDKLIKSMKRVSTGFSDDVASRTSYKQALNATGYYNWYRYYMGISKAPKGFIITGMRFQVFNNSILYIQIQVGQMIDHGEVNSTSVHWQEPNEDIEVNYFHSTSLYFKFGNSSFNDAVLTGIQFMQYNGYLTTIAYGHKVNDNNLGTMDDKIIKKEFFAVNSRNINNFASDDIELNIKSPLSGFSFYYDNNDIIIPRLITYNAHHFIKNIDIDAPIKQTMSNFAKEKIRGLIHEEKDEIHSKTWIYVLIGGLTGFAIMTVVIIIVVIVFRRREKNIRESLIYDSVYQN